MSAGSDGVLLLDYTKTFLKDLVLPPSGLLLLAASGLLCLSSRPRLGRALLALGIGALWLLSLPIVSDELALWNERYGALDLRTAPGAAAIVILGGGSHREQAREYGGPSADAGLLERLAYGAYLAHRLALPVLVTGFHVEAQAMRASLERSFDIVPRWVDADAYDTFDNARDSARLLQTAGVRRIVLVTDAQHIARATHEFRAAGMQVLPAPMDLMPPRGAPITPFRFIPSASALERSAEVVYEWLGEAVRVSLAATGLRRQHPAPLPAGQTFVTHSLPIAPPRR